jgi:hypothetical protein
MQMMKVYLLLVVFLATHLHAFGELTAKELKQFKSELEIGGARTSTWKGDDRKKSELLEVNTFQSEDDPLTYDMSRFQMRLVVELTDKNSNTYLAKFIGNAPESYDSEYQGEDYWKFYMAHGEYERLKITGYVVQYGIMDGETFVSLAEDESKSDKMLERVREQTTTLFSGKVYLRHYYMYIDSGIGLTESTPVNIRAVKK